MYEWVTDTFSFHGMFYLFIVPFTNEVDWNTHGDDPASPRVLRAGNSRRCRPPRQLATRVNYAS